MSIFEFVTIAVSIVLGLAVTSLLESLVLAFRSRRVCRLDWLPFVWVACVLLTQFQYLWAIFELRDLHEIGIGDFVLLITLSGLLYLSAALVLPSGEAEYPADLAEYFAADGSWGVAPLALYSLVAIAVNHSLFGEAAGSLLSLVNLLNVALAVIAAAVAVLHNRRALVALTAAYITVLVISEIAASQGAYTE